MIPKLALNYTINKDTNVKDLPQLFEKMKWHKVVYIEVKVCDMDTIEKLQPIITAFKTMRSKHCIDYTIWIDIGVFGLAYEKAAELFKKASAIDRLVMGLCGIGEVMDLPNYQDRMGRDRFPDLYEVMEYSDDVALKYSQKVINEISAPEGMKRGLNRVLMDYVNLYGTLAPREVEPQELSDQDSE